MLNWLLYTMLVGGLLTLAAHCVGRVCQLLARPTRWVWASVLTLMVVLVSVASYRAAAHSHTQFSPRVTRLISSEVRQQTMPPIGRLSESVQFVRREMTTPMITIPGQRVPVALDAYLAVAWGTLSVIALLFFFTVYLRFRRVQRGWPISELHGVRVRIAPAGGPVVIGLRHPEIVIPQWLLGRSVEEQRIVLTHEQEHIRAGDPWVLAVACVIAALLPWHPMVWWMISRLRLAIELDCDTRVLRQGVAPQTYGSLLIDLAGRCSGLPVRALALADNRSHLTQRLLAMKSLRPRFATTQGLFFGCSALFLLVTAGVAQVPTPADRQKESTAQHRAAAAVLLAGVPMTSHAQQKPDTQSQHSMVDIDQIKGDLANMLFQSFVWRGDSLVVNASTVAMLSVIVDSVFSLEKNPDPTYRQIDHDDSYLINEILNHTHGHGFPVVIEPGGPAIAFHGRTATQGVVLIQGNCFQPIKMIPGREWFRNHAATHPNDGHLSERDLAKFPEHGLLQFNTNCIVGNKILSDQQPGAY